MTLFFVLLFLLSMLLFAVVIPAVALLGYLKPTAFNRPDRPLVTRAMIVWTCTVCEIILLFVILGSYAMLPKRGDTTIAETSPAPNVQRAAMATPVPSASAQPVEPYSIVVSSVMVKHVGTQYRYFFDIRNHDTKPFEGEVTIQLYNAVDKEVLAQKTFTTPRPLEPGLGAPMSIDAFTAPPSVHGANGISKFVYRLTHDGTVVATGEGEITDNYEDTEVVVKALGGQ